jgi:hypothetical protein
VTWLQCARVRPGRITCAIHLTVTYFTVGVASTRARASRTESVDIPARASCMCTVHIFRWLWPLQCACIHPGRTTVDIAHRYNVRVKFTYSTGWSSFNARARLSVWTTCTVLPNSDIFRWLLSLRCARIRPGRTTVNILRHHHARVQSTIFHWLGSVASTRARICVRCTTTHTFSISKRNVR